LSVQSYSQYCPIAKGAEVFADRWTPLILRELLAGACGFNQLHRGLPGVSRSLLLDRLRSLERAGVLTNTPNSRGKAAQYALTAAGLDLQAVIESLGDWGARWAMRDPDPNELDPYLVVLWISRHVDWSAVPPQRVVIEFEVSGAKVKRLWLVLTPDEASVCLKYPGFETDLRVTAATATLYEVYLGRTSLSQARRTGSVHVEGPTTLIRALPRWFTWSKFAPAVRSTFGHGRRPATR
jgi:DNA-binding HxlR family transcriptional regulator